MFTNMEATYTPPQARPSKSRYVDRVNLPRSTSGWDRRCRVAVASGSGESKPGHMSVGFRSMPSAARACFGLRRTHGRGVRHPA